MSQENVELVRAAFTAYNRGDLDALVEFYYPDVVFETLLSGDPPRQGGRTSAL